MQLKSTPAYLMANFGKLSQIEIRGVLTLTSEEIRFQAKSRKVPELVVPLDAIDSVRCFEEMGSIQWSAGLNGMTPSVHYNKNFFRGRVLFKKQSGMGYAFKDKGPPEAGKVYEYKFDVDEIRGPIEATVKESGWEWVPVVAKRHATYPEASSPGSSGQPGGGYCSQCGAQVGRGDNFCHRCGHQIG